MYNSPESSENSKKEHNVYWFLRYLVASRYGNYASKEITQLRRLSSRIDTLIEEDDDLKSIKKEIEDIILGPVSKEYGDDISKRYRQTEDLVERISRKISSKEAVKDLKIAIKIVIRTTEIQEGMLQFGRDEIVKIIDETLNVNTGKRVDPSKAYDALYNVDMKGEEHQLGAQREALVEYSKELMKKDYSDLDRDKRIRILTALSQEYERRAGQSRSSTAGGVLETALQHLFDRFGIEASGKTEHMGDLEIDNKVEGPEGSIGFSCKRTLRERFRQSLRRQSDIGVDEIWFVALMMADISKDKVKNIGEDGGRIYVPRDSYVWNHYSDDQEVKDALYPADNFLEDISRFTGLSIKSSSNLDKS